MMGGEVDCLRRSTHDRRPPFVLLLTEKKSMKKQRSDSAQGSVNAFSGALSEIAPPNALSDGELRYWNAITRARAREDWTTIDLFRAWNLSKLFFQIEQAHHDIDTNGMMLLNDKGTQINNPAFSRLEVLTRLASSEATKLHVHAEATVGKSEDSAKRATKQRQAEDAMTAAGEKTLSDFIARPSLN